MNKLYFWMAIACLAGAIAITIVTALMFWPRAAAQTAPSIGLQMPLPIPLHVQVQEYLLTKKSPLAPQADYLIKLPHWKLILAISNAEGQFCQHQLYYNCWGLGGNQNLREYSSYKASLQDINDFIESWQVKGKWMTPEQMNCSYVVPCSPNWLRTVKATLKELENF